METDLYDTDKLVCIRALYNNFSSGKWFACQLEIANMR
jgi:hypothetical protein